MGEGYVHGYHERETERLRDQARTLVDLLHWDSVFPEGTSVLEAGCGVGAQTVTLAARNPTARITAVDISPASLEQARERVAAAGCGNVTFRQGDIFDLPFAPGSFDEVFVCFVLEHLPDPIRALASLKKLLKPGGAMTVIEGDHGSVYFHPENEAARRAIGCQVELQARGGGNALVGRQLYPLLTAAGFETVTVSPRMVYVDASRPELVEGFTRKTFTAMIEGVREKAVQSGLLDAESFDEGLRALQRTTEADGVFCYTFFKARGMKG